MHSLSKNPLKPYSYQDHLSIRSIFRSDLFIYGLLIRVFIIFFSPSSVQSRWFIPFLSRDTFFTIDPWTRFLSTASYLPDSFPYGIITYIYYKFFIFIGFLFTTLSSYIQPYDFAYIFFNFGTVLLDVATLVSIVFLLPSSRLYAQRIVFLYWLSPIIIYALYWHGQIDIIPIFFLLCALICLQSWRFVWSGILIAAAVSCKFSIIICFPFYFIFLIKHSFYNRNINKVLLGFIPTLTLLFGTYALISAGFQQMVLGTPIALKILDLSIVFNLESSILRFYVILFAYLFLIYYFCSFERINWDLFLCFATLSLYTLVVFVFPSPGWFVWIVPFAVIYIIGAEGFSSKLYLISSIQYLLYFTTASYFDKIETSSISSVIQNLLFTLMQALMIMQMVSIYQYGIRKNKFYRTFPTPFLLIAAGTNSMMTKQFTALFHKLMSSHRPFTLDIDDYYKYSQSADLVNPQILPKLIRKDNVYNYDFSRFLNDLYRVKSHLMPSSTDTKINTRFVKSQTLKRVKFVTSCVPASFSSNNLIFNVSDFSVVILDHTYSDIYELPSCLEADIVFILTLASSHYPHNTELIERVKLKAILSNFYHQDIIQKKLIATCGLNVDILYLEDGKSVEMNFDGECSKEDLILVLRSVLPLAENLISDITAFSSGHEGLMQLLMITSLASQYSLSNSHSLV